MNDLAKHAASLRAVESDEGFVEVLRRSPVDFVDLKFTDLPGRWHHVTVPAARFEARILTKGVGFDGSSVEGYKSVERGDMVLVPDRATPTIDEIDGHVVLSLVGSAAEAESRRPRGHPGRAERSIPGRCRGDGRVPNTATACPLRPPRPLG